MDETRNALTDKIATLEAQVVETVEGASANVRETVETIKDAVQDTVQTVRDSVSDSFDSVRETFSLDTQIVRRPWTVLALSAGLGFAAGYLLTPPARRERARTTQLGGPYMSSPPALAPSTRATEAPSPQSAVNWRLLRTRQNRRQRPPRASTTSQQRNPHPNRPRRRLTGCSTTWHRPSAARSPHSRTLAPLGGLIHDVVVPQIPEAFKEKVHEVIDNVTSKLGGEPVKGPLFGEEKLRRAGERATRAFGSLHMGSHN